MPFSELSLNVYLAFLKSMEVMGYLVIALFITNILPVGNKERLIESVLPVQLVVFGALVTYPYPGNVMVLYREVKEFACFNLVPRLT